jgi:hypothetical protein
LKNFLRELIFPCIPNPFQAFLYFINRQFYLPNKIELSEILDILAKKFNEVIGHERKMIGIKAIARYKRIVCLAQVNVALTFKRASILG